MRDKRVGLESSNTSGVVYQGYDLLINLFILSSRPYGFNVPYREFFQAFEKILVRHQGRPHWAKPHHLRRDELRALYPCFDDFTRVLDTVDPTGIFRNEYIHRHIMGRAVDARVFKSIR